MTTVRFEKLHPDAKIPTRATPGSAGLDLYAVEDATIQPGIVTRVPLGLRMALEPGFEAQIRPRSGNAAKGLTAVNSPGTVDADYRGELGLLVTVCIYGPYFTKKGDRIAQLVIQRVEPVTIEVSGERMQHSWKVGEYASCRRCGEQHEDVNEWEMVRDAFTCNFAPPIDPNGTSRGTGGFGSTGK